MGYKRICGLLATCAIILTGISIPVGAKAAVKSIDTCLSWSSAGLQVTGTTTIQPLATGKVDVSISAKKMATVGDSFSLSPGEAVTINCSYSPSWADLDFGLVTSDGSFYYVNTTSGSINKTIEVEEWGQYNFAVRNNSSVDVSVVGFVNY